MISTIETTADPVAVTPPKQFRALVTGAARGLGKRIAEEFEQRGWHVFKPTRGILDLSNAASIAAYVRRFHDRKHELDVLVNNAAVLSPKAVDCFAVNCLGPWMLMDGLWPALVKSRGVVVNVTSHDGSTGKSDFARPGYSISKAALNHLTRMYATLGAKSGVTVLGFDPGVFESDMNPAGTHPPPGEDVVALCVEEPANGTLYGAGRPVSPLKW